MYCELVEAGALEVLVVVVGALELEVTEGELVVVYLLDDVLEEDVVLYSELDGVEDEWVEAVMLDDGRVDVELVAKEL